MWLFGSLAAGPAVASGCRSSLPFRAGLGCARRWDRGRESARLVKRAAGWPVDGVVTDRPGRERYSALRGRLRALWARSGLGSAGPSRLAAWDAGDEEMRLFF